MEKKICLKCSQEKEISEFNWKHKQRGVRHSNCRMCTKEITRNHYSKNKDAYKKRAVAFTKKQREHLAVKMVEYLRKHPCVDCGETDPIVLQFDHVRGSKKNAVGIIVNQGLAMSTLITEIEKCEIRCANCHCRKTAKERGWKYKLDQ